MTMPVLINPVLGTTTVLPPPTKSRADISMEQSMVLGLLLRRSVPLNLALRLLEHYGWPEDLLGTGSFAVVFADPRNPKDWVLKFSNDEVDGTTSSYIQMCQEGRVKIDEHYSKLTIECLPRIRGVGLVEFTNRADEKDNLWVINVERVMPLVNDDREESLRVRRHIIAAFEDYLRPRQQEVLAVMSSRRREGRSYANLPADLRRKMMKSLSAFQQSLSEKSADEGDALEETAANMLGDASMSVETLLAIGAPVVDLHAGNFGFKLDMQNEPTTNLVVTDFGLSSLDDQQRQKAYAGATELRTAPKKVRGRRVEDPRQMKLFENSGLSHKELVALTRVVLGGPEALRMKDYHADVSTVRSLIRKGYFVKGGVSPQGRKLVESLGTKAPLF